MTSITGLHSVSTIEYENITIAEALQGRERTGLTVTFTTEKVPGAACSVATRSDKAFAPNLTIGPVVARSGWSDH